MVLSRVEWRKVRDGRRNSVKLRDQLRGFGQEEQSPDRTHTATVFELVESSAGNSHLSSIDAKDFEGCRTYSTDGHSMPSADGRGTENSSVRFYDFENEDVVADWQLRRPGPSTRKMIPSRYTSHIQVSNGTGT